MKYLLILFLLLSGCSRPDGLYIDGKLIKAGASVEEFCKAKGHKELVDSRLCGKGKVCLGKEE